MLPAASIAMSNSACYCNKIFMLLMVMVLEIDWPMHHW